MIAAMMIRFMDAMDKPMITDAMPITMDQALIASDAAVAVAVETEQRDASLSTITHAITMSTVAR